MSDLKAYLASKYMSGPKADHILAQSDPTRKKRKKKSTAETGPKANLLLRDEDVGLGIRDDDDETELESPLVTEVAAKFIKTKANWSKLAKDNEAESSKNAQASSSSTPAPTDADADAPPPPKKRRGGLRTAADLAAEAAEKAAAKAKSPDPEPARAQETVHRDESGRVLDIKALKAEEKRKQREEQEKEAKRMEWGKGLVQAEEKEERRKREAREALKDVARHADDEDMNNEMKQEERWNDPAAAFLTKKKTSKAKGPQKPKYNKGPIPMNRFGIPPGYRWDGVDRSTGFEKKYFQYQNAGQRRKLEAMQWSVEDM